MKFKITVIWLWAESCTILHNFYCKFEAYSFCSFNHLYAFNYKDHSSGSWLEKVLKLISHIPNFPLLLQINRAYSLNFIWYLIYPLLLLHYCGVIHELDKNVLHLCELWICCLYVMSSYIKEALLWKKWTELNADVKHFLGTLLMSPPPNVYRNARFLFFSYEFCIYQLVLYSFFSFNTLIWN